MEERLAQLCIRQGINGRCLDVNLKLDVAPISKSLFNVTEHHLHTRPRADSWLLDSGSDKRIKGRI